MLSNPVTTISPAPPSRRWPTGAAQFRTPTRDPKKSFITIGKVVLYILNSFGIKVRVHRIYGLSEFDVATFTKPCKQIHGGIFCEVKKTHVAFVTDKYARYQHNIVILSFYDIW